MKLRTIETTSSVATSGIVMTTPLMNNRLTLEAGSAMRPVTCGDAETVGLAGGSSMDLFRSECVPRSHVFGR